MNPMTVGNTTTQRPDDATTTGAAVEIDQVAVRFRTKKKDVTALRDVSLRIEPGEFVSIVGASGCGKSTLLKLVSGLLRPSSGQVRLHGEDVRGRGATSGTSSSAPRCWSGARPGATSCSKPRCATCPRRRHASASTS